jgi:recombination protein U
MNYPVSKNKSNNNYVNYAHRGMTLESDINQTNKYYLDNDIALIYKKPTPIKVVKVKYNKRINTQITEAYYETPSTTDYNGIYKGKYIDFEAKESKSKTSFSLNNIHDHQVTHLIKVLEHGGISFLIIRFTTLNKTFILSTSKLIDFIKNYNRKSIPLDYFEKNGKLVIEKFSPRTDYLKIVDELIEENLEVHNEKE